MSILSTNKKLISLAGTEYSAGQGIDITNHVISVVESAVGEHYSAGPNIDIYDDEGQPTISSKDWTNDIEQASANAYNVTTAWVQDNYANSADMTYISAMVDTKLDTSAWSSVSGDLATESYVIMADNINYAQATAYVENQNYANKDFVLANIDSATSGKLDSSSFASVSSDFLTTAFGISESGAWNEATNCVENNSAAWFDNQGDVEVNELVYAQSANWNEVSSKLDSTAFDTWQQGQYTNDIAGLNNLIGTKLDASSFEETSGTFYPTSNPSGFITGVDLTPYYTTAEANTLSSMLSGAIDFVSANAGGVISSYTTAYSHDIPPYGGEVINSLNGKFLSAFVSLSADNAKVATNANSATYAQTIDETKLVNDGFVKNLTSEYGTISVVRNTIESTNSAISRVGNEGFVSSYSEQTIGKIVTANFSWDKSLPNTTFNFTEVYASPNTPIYYSANTNLTGVVSPTSIGEITFSIEVPNATAVDIWSNYWIQIKNNVASAADSFETVVGELAWASALPTYEYDITNKISAINGSALAGGGDVPTGTMNVSGLEYNAVNEISAYNGSAIAQYGAEKQWLVHDDTLVHAANSAQYALGVNLSAVAQLLGVDETVLWTSSWNGNRWDVELTEPITNFKKVNLYVTRGDGAGEPKSYLFETDILPMYLTLEVDSTFSNDIYKFFTLCTLSGTKYTELSARMMGYPGSLGDWNNTNFWCHPIKIVGIGRKQ